MSAKLYNESKGVAFSEIIHYSLFIKRQRYKSGTGGARHSLYIVHCTLKSTLYIKKLEPFVRCIVKQLILNCK